MITDVDVSFLPDLDYEGDTPVIIQMGNYFIMDSEQLVSNPFAELQQEAVNQAESHNRRTSMTEKLTSVKNNVCENHFQMARTRLEREKTSRLKQLHDHSNKLRHEVKLLDLDKQRHQVEIKRRIDPEKDHSYDVAQVSNTEKRLGANIASFYLEKRLKYPVRIRSVNDISITPTVQRARASLRQTEQQKNCDENNLHATTNGNGSKHGSRAQTAKSVSSSLAHSHKSNSPPRSNLLRRRDSRSAPLGYARSRSTADRNNGGGGAGRNMGSAQGRGLLPAIPLTAQQQRAQAAADARPPWSQPAETTTNDPQQAPPAIVKFAFENPLKILASNEESTKLFTQPNAAYYPGATRAVHHHHHHGNGHMYSDTEDDDDDDEPGLPDRIDLRAMFFGKDVNGNNTNTSVQNGDDRHVAHKRGGDNERGSTPVGGVTLNNTAPALTPHQLAMLRKAQGPPPRLTTDMMQVEMDKINSKVKSFMTTLTRSQTMMHHRKFTLIDELSAAEDAATATANSNTAGQHEQPVVPRFSSKGTNTNDNIPGPVGTNNANSSNNVSTLKSASDSNLERSVAGINSETNNNGNVAVAENGSEINSADKSDEHEHAKHEQKYNWKLIRGREQTTNIWKDDLGDGEGGGENDSATKCRPEDLVLQALTGIPIRNALQTHVPLHSASRALRHTATYKMHKVVEKLINDRTKYQRHQVNELKRQMSIDNGSSNGNNSLLSGVLDNNASSTASNGVSNGGGATGGNAAFGSEGRRVSRVSVSSVGSDKRKLAAR